VKKVSNFIFKQFTFSLPLPPVAGSDPNVAPDFPTMRAAPHSLQDPCMDGQAHQRRMAPSQPGQFDRPQGSLFRGPLEISFEQFAEALRCPGTGLPQPVEALLHFIGAGVLLERAHQCFHGLDRDLFPRSGGFQQSGFKPIANRLGGDAEKQGGLPQAEEAFRAGGQGGEDRVGTLGYLPSHRAVLPRPFGWFPGIGFRLSGRHTMKTVLMDLLFRIAGLKVGVGADFLQLFGEVVLVRPL